jgi:hypothetical protein
MKRAEDQIQRAILEHLAIRAVPNVFAFHCPNGGWRRPAEARIFKSLGVRAGIPDVLVVAGGKLYALELKTAHGKLTPAQRTAHVMLTAAGAEVATAHGLDEALAVLERWGLLRVSTKV